MADMHDGASGAARRVRHEVPGDWSDIPAPMDAAAMKAPIAPGPPAAVPLSPRQRRALVGCRAAEARGERMGACMMVSMAELRDLGLVEARFSVRGLVEGWATTPAGRERAP